ncbi:MAG: class I SAM-dependent methyltransferase [Candidatus Hydrogenedentes bacterium]|nr:class I SAM-dependent methyltransferase [Candidatus Hydrogenedentota bacterium]
MAETRAYYEGEYAERRLDIDAHRTNRLEFCLEPSLAGKDILDVGCGPGVQLQYLAASNRLVGVDISAHALRRASGNGYLCCQGDLDGRALPFRDGSFDIVVCTDVFEHLFQPLALLKEIRRVLKSEGVAFLSVPNHFELMTRLRILFGGGAVWASHKPDSHAWDYAHIRYFTPRSFRAFLAEGAFAPEQSYAGFSPSPMVHVLSLLLERDYPKDWRSRHPDRRLMAAVLRLASLLARGTLLPAVVLRWLPHALPALFSSAVFHRCVKAGGPGSR